MANKSKNQKYSMSWLPDIELFGAYVLKNARTATRQAAVENIWAEAGLGEVMLGEGLNGIRSVNACLLHKDRSPSN